MTPGILDLLQPVIVLLQPWLFFFPVNQRGEKKEGNLRDGFSFCFHGHRFIILYESQKSVVLIKSVLGDTSPTAQTNAIK